MPERPIEPPIDSRGEPPRRDWPEAMDLGDPIERVTTMDRLGRYVRGMWRNWFG